MSPSRRPMRVLLAAPRFPPDVGGLESYAGWVARTLAASPDHDVRVVTSHSGRGRLEDEVDGIPVTRLGSWVTLSNTPVNPLWLVQLRRLIRDFRPDVVNVHSPVPGLADAIVAVAGPIPVVMTYHAGSLVKKESRAIDAVLRSYERWVLPRIFDRCAELVAVSPVAMTHATGRATMITPGVDTDFFSPDPSATRGRRMLFVGRVEASSRWKGIATLVEALALAAPLVPGIGLDVVGDGDDIDRLQRLARARGVSDLVTWHGSLTHTELVGLYRSAGVTVLPSLTEAESFGMALVEAMATGCPLVGSDVGGIPFVLAGGEHGLLVDPGDAAGLAAAVERVLLDPSLSERLSEGGRRAAVERWDWCHQSAATTGVLARAVRGSLSRTV